MAQLVAHLLCKQRVAGSNPASSTLRTLGIKLILRVFLFAFSARFHLESAKIVRANGTRMAQSRLSPVQRPRRYLHHGIALI